jgi:hypothetical protein
MFTKVLEILLGQRMEFGPFFPSMIYSATYMYSSLMVFVGKNITAWSSIISFAAIYSDASMEHL